MDTKEHKAYLASFKKYSKKLSASKQEAEDFLVRSGIYNSQRALDKAYVSK